MKRILIFSILFATHTFADNTSNINSTPQTLPNNELDLNINPNNNHTTSEVTAIPPLPEPPIMTHPNQNQPSAQTTIAPPAVPNMPSGNSNQSGTGPIFTLTDADKKDLKDLNKFLEEINPKIKEQISEFEETMKTLRALSQQSYDKLSHEAKLALKGKKDKIDHLSEPAKKVYFRNE